MAFAMLFNCVLPISAVFALNSYTITFSAQGTHSMVMDEGHLKIDGQYVELRNSSNMSVGTARLDVKDIDLTEEQISNFEEAAVEYKVKKNLDISLFNTVYKGNSTQSWDTQVKDLDNEAEIFLQLADDVNGEDIVIVHEKHDGTYEIIQTEYLEEYNAIAFKTKSFSNYAIATKTSSIDNDSNSSITNTKTTSTKSNPQTEDNVMFYISMLGISLLGIAITRMYIKKRFN